MIGITNKLCMMKTLRIIILTAVYSVTCLNCYSQYKKNAVVLDLAGKTVYYFDISYERYLSERFHLGAGAGLAGISTLYKSNSEKATELNVRFPIYLGYNWGKKKNHLTSELGLTIDSNLCSFGSYILNLWPFISLGYEFKSDNIIIRVPVYLGYVGKNEFFPAIMPWAGLSIGVPF
jgi:hypothetical protein